MAASEEAHRKGNGENTDQSSPDDLIYIMAKGICPVQYEPREKTGFLHKRKQMQISCAVTVQLISAFVFST